jgi:hypothetical protein
VGIERARVVEVQGSPASRVAAGYLIADRLVLTAGDVTGDRAQVRVGGTVSWSSAATVWTAGRGAVAVVEVDEPLAMPAPMRWGEVAGARPVPVAAMGFPPPEGRRPAFRDPEQFFGHLRAGTLEAAPTSPLSGSGLHGAALFAGAELVGVISAAANGLTAVASAAFAGDPSFVDLVGPVELVPVRASPGFSIL